MAGHSAIMAQGFRRRWAGFFRWIARKLRLRQHDRRRRIPAGRVRDYPPHLARDIAIDRLGPGFCPGPPTPQRSQFPGGLIR